MNLGYFVGPPTFFYRTTLEGASWDDPAGRAYEVAIGIPALAQERSNRPFRAHVSIWRCLWTLGWQFVEDAFEEAQHTLIESSASYTRPRGEPVGASDPYAQDQARVFEHPCDHRMVDGNELVNPRFGAEFQGAEEPSDELHSDLDAAVTLRVVGRRVLLRDGSQAAALHSGPFQNLLDESLQGWFIVGLKNQFCVA